MLRARVTGTSATRSERTTVIPRGAAMEWRALRAAAIAFTVSVAVCDKDPAGGSEQVSVYAKDPVVAGVTFTLPAGFCWPLHAPLAVHPETPADDQLSTALCPTVMVVGVTLIVMIGVGVGGGVGVTGNGGVAVLYEQAKKAEACAQSATKPAHQTSTLERDLRLFDTCMARAALSPPDRSGTLSVRTLRSAGQLPESFRLCFPFTLPVTRWQGKERA